jgi:LPS-assembly lipoprotein
MNLMTVSRALLAAMCLLALSACGYKPLYGTSSDSRGVAEALSSVSIAAPDTRLTQIIRNDLLSSMRPAGTDAQDRYKLVLQETTKTSDVIDRQQPNATRQSVNVSVDFQLSQGQAIVYSGKTFSQISYDQLNEPFADTQAKQNAFERAAHELSADIRTRLAAYFSSH